MKIEIRKHAILYQFALILLVLLTLPWISLAIEDIPGTGAPREGQLDLETFGGGDTANASDVNHNFELLRAKINEILGALNPLPTNCTDGQVVQWDSSQSEFVCVTPNTDTLSCTQNDEVLVWNSNNSHFVCKQIASCSMGEALKWNGSDFSCVDIGNPDGYCASGDNDTELFIHPETNGSGGLLDSSLNNNPISAYGDNMHTNVVHKFGGTGLYFDGDGDYLTVANSQHFDFGNGDFTIEFWLQSDGQSGNSRGILKKGDDLGFQSYAIFINADNQVRFLAANPHNTGWQWDKTIGTASQTQMDHFAIVRSGNGFYTYKNGEQTNHWDNAGYSLVSSGSELTIGSQGPGTEFKGYLDEIRISSVARSPNGFPPTQPYCN